MLLEFDRRKMADFGIQNFIIKRPLHFQMYCLQLLRRALIVV